MSRPIDRQTPRESGETVRREIDRVAIDQLVVEHLPAALRLARRLTGDANVAEELVQESLCRVLRQWRSYRGESQFKTWLLQIVVNADRDRRRRIQPRLHATDDLPPEATAAGASGAHQQLVADELGEQIRQEIDRLPERQREVALLSFGEQLPPGEIAELLETTPANVHTCLHLARKRIAEAIGVAYPQAR